jgi:predicted transcriptional regulator YdeE
MQQRPPLQQRTVERPAFAVAGLAVRTSQARQALDAGPLAARFFAPGFAESLNGRTDPSATYAVHAGYDAADETYRLFLGFEVDPLAQQPADVDVIVVPAGRYTVFTAVGPQPQASIDAWREILAWRSGPDLVRSGVASFEVHDDRVRGATPEVDIYIPAVAA